jgi:SNF2 family DNA or RNA helicase
VAVCWLPPHALPTYVRRIERTRSGITIEDYQLDPVVRALRMSRVNLLIADDTGVGKTIEAGLVVQELLLRHRARTILVVCPASLCIKWRDEMHEKFGLAFRIVDSELLRHLRRTRGLYANPWTHFPRLIVSIDWVKSDRPMRLLRDVLPPVGPLVQPQASAHKLEWSGYADSSWRMPASSESTRP